jgi:hypothetical protein
MLREPIGMCLALKIGNLFPKGVHNANSESEDRRSDFCRRIFTSSLCKTSSGARVAQAATERE